MGNFEKSSEAATPQPLNISLKLLGGFVLAYLLGLATHLMAKNFFSGQTLTFSTPELINFVLSVLLSGASIFLAIAAIALGRFSEQAIVQRSDESIRLQNEVFQKTTDALQRIESSTGVTEKRIEDIISGRVGDLSQKIARIATETQDTEGKDVEPAIRKALYETLREEGILPRRPDPTMTSVDSILRARTEDESKDKYNRMSTAFMQALSLRNELKAVKMGRGTVGKSGDDLYDGLYLRSDGTRIGIVDFAPHHQPELITRGIIGALRDLQNGNVAKVYVVFYGPKSSIEQVFEDAVSIADPELKKRISLVICPPEQISDIAGKLSVS
jgi:acyl-CoA hydrolase